MYFIMFATVQAECGDMAICVGLGWCFALALYAAVRPSRLAKSAAQLNE